MTDIKKPEKKKVRGFTHAGHGRGYNQAIDDFRAYYESDNYIQSLIDDGRIVIDEVKIKNIISTPILMRPNTASQAMDSVVSATKAITQSNPLRVKSKEEK